ncbi:PAS domain S-box protein [Reinekea marinisedimentorum]|uniref:histidine kinase n=1 Tax=Reinekea marinisedimentorum TaxID=230495 RepID=A0A4R3IAX1_9GAMM|nr:PAS domain S-box protein [Reinekea marinisedimentorum]TCS42391.1 PAS domain S-box-containing protein [Reinekea marinisedimentorum]
MRISFRTKTIVGIAVIEALFLSLLIVNSIKILSSSHEDELEYRANTLTNVFSHAVADAVLSLDLATLYTLVDDLLASDEVLQVEVANRQRTLILKTKENATVTAEQAIQSERPIRVGDSEFGYVRLWLDSTYVEDVVAHAKFQSIRIAVIEILFVSLASIALGAYLTTQLSRLRGEIKKVGEGDLSPTERRFIPNDELGDTLTAFTNLKAALSAAESERAEVLRRVSELAEENLQKELWLKTIINQLVDGVVAFNAKGDIQYANAPAQKLFGYLNEPLAGLNIFTLPWTELQKERIAEFIHRDPSDQVRESLTRHSDEVLYRMDGSSISAILTLSHTSINDESYFILTLHEMVWRKQVDDQLAVSDAIRTGMLESSSSAVIAIDDDGLILEFNPAAERLFGYRRQQVLGQDMAELIMPERLREGHRMGMAHYKKTKEGPILRQVVEVVAHNCEGREFPIELAVAPIETKSGTIFTAVISDISERIKNTERLQQAKEDADDANREKSRFLASMSHEIRTPLNIILGMVDLLQNTPLNDKQRGFTLSAENAGRNLLDMVNDILDLSKIEAGKMEPKLQTINPVQLFEETVQLFNQRCIAKNLALTIETSSELPKAVVTDASFYRQIISNLMANAVNYTNNGSITARLQIKTINGLPHLSAEIEDTGVGLSPEEQKQLFQEFTQVHQAHPKQTKGSGIGLVICRELANLCGGDITLTSEVGKGSTFAFQLPVTLAEISEPAQQPRVEQAHNVLKGARILLVEDSEANRVIANTFLEDAGCIVTEAVDGLDAIEQVKSHHFDAILMDMRMPNMGGVEAAEHIRRNQLAESTPIIALTAHALVEVRDNCLAVGMQDFLTKPIERKLLLRTLNHWLTEPMQNSQAAPAEPVINDENDLLIFDEGAVNQLIEDTSEKAVSHMLNVFFRECDQRLKLILQARQDADSEAMGVSAHALKSSAKTFGAMQLSAVAEKLEAACANADAALQETLVDQLPELMADTKGLMNTMLANWWQPETQEQT